MPTEQSLQWSISSNNYLDEELAMIISVFDFSSIEVPFIRLAYKIYWLPFGHIHVWRHIVDAYCG